MTYAISAKLPDQEELMYVRSWNYNKMQVILTNDIRDAYKDQLKTALQYDMEDVKSISNFKCEYKIVLINERVK